MIKKLKNVIEGSLIKWGFLEKKDDIIPYAFLAPALIILGGILFFPLVYSFVLSFFNWNMTQSGGAEFVFLDNFIELFGNSAFWHSVRLQVLFVVISVFLELIIGLGVAMLLNHNFAGEHVVRALLLLPVFILPVVSGLTFRFMYDPQYGAINWLLGLIGFNPIAFLSDSTFAFVAIIIQDVWRMWPFMFMILYASLSSLPESPYEAAAISGATKWQVFRHVTLPMLKPSIVIAVILRIVNALKAFSEIYVMTNGGPGDATSIMSIFIYKNAFDFYEMGYSAAASYVLVAIALAFSIYLVKTQFEF